MRTARIRSASIGILAGLALLAAACGGDSVAEPDDGTTTGAEATDDSTDSGDSGDDWQAVLDAAREEGTVTIYSSQDPALLAEVGAQLQEQYGITLEVVRDIDSTLAQRNQADHQAGSVTADVFVTATPQVLEGMTTEGWITAPAGPAFASDAYDDSMLTDGGYWEIASAILTLGWNSDLVPEALTDYPDVLNEEFAGRIGVIEPAAPSIVDFWVWLAETHGEDYADQLAALNPRIYPSSLPMAEALASGEIAVGTFVPPSVLDASKEDGAPVEYVVPNPVWGAHFYGAVQAEAPHPNAAQVLANYLVTPEGQEIIAADQGSALPDVESALAYNLDVRYLDQELLTDEFVRTFQEDWRATFQ